MRLRIGILFLVIHLVACKTYFGYELKPGVDHMEKVLDVLGQPAMRWQRGDGTEQLVFPRGPMGYRTYKVTIDKEGRMLGIENVLNENNFTLIQPGMNKEDVLHILGPSQPNWTVYFERRNELVWEWRYCDTWNEAARFNVLFDYTDGTVRSTLSLTESQRGICGKERCSC